MKTILIGLATITFLVMLSLGASAHDGVASYIWGPGDPNYNPSAVVYPGTLDTTDLIAKDFLGIEWWYPYGSAWGTGGAAINWDDGWLNWHGVHGTDFNWIDGNHNGDALDGYWVQLWCIQQHDIFEGGLDIGRWDLGPQATNMIAVATNLDHPPYLGEGLEFRVYGTDADNLWNNTLSNQAVVTEVYLDGWRIHNNSEDINQNGWTSDDIVAVLELPGYYRYIKVTPWQNDPETCGEYTSWLVDEFNEPEIDAVLFP